MITVKVIRVPGVAVEVGLNDGASVSDALSAANMTLAAGEQLTVNGMEASTDTILADADRVILAKAAKGN
jgi:hypothetical protein